MYTIKDIKNCIQQRIIPNEEEVSLKLYCDYFEKEIEKHIVQVDLCDGSSFIVKTNARHVAHILDLHKFHDPNLKDKKLKYPGAFTKIDGFYNMKKGIITKETLIKAKRGIPWKNDSTRYRVLCFPYILKALLEGTWYKFDINKYKGETKLIPLYIVNYRVQNIQLNFCIDKDNVTDEHFCISNIIAFKSNSRIENQDYLDIDRIIDYLSGDIIERCLCHNRLYKTKFRNNKFCHIAIIDSATHKKLIARKCLVNSNRITEDLYQVRYLKMDSNVAKIIDKAKIKNIPTRNIS